MDSEYITREARTQTSKAIAPSWPPAGAPEEGLVPQPVAVGAKASMKVNWVNNDPTATGTQVEYLPEGATVWVVAGVSGKGVIQRTVGELEPGKTYKFRVKAIKP